MEVSSVTPVNLGSEESEAQAIIARHREAERRTMSHEQLANSECGLEGQITIESVSFSKESKSGTLYATIGAAARSMDYHTASILFHGAMVGGLFVLFWRTLHSMRLAALYSACAFVVLVISLSVIAGGNYVELSAIF